MKYLILVLLLSSCSVLKKTVKTHDREQQKIEASAEEKTVTETKTEGKAKTVTTEEMDTTFQTAGERLTARSTDIKNEPLILEGKEFTTIVFDSAGVTKATTVVKPQTVHAKNKKRTEREESRQQTKTVKSDSTGEFKEKLKSETDTKDRGVKKTGLLIPWWIWLVLVLILAGFAWWKFRPF